MNPYFSWPEVRRGKTRFNFFLLSSLNKITSRKASLTLQTFPTILTLKENIAPHSTQQKKNVKTLKAYVSLNETLQT